MMDLHERLEELAAAAAREGRTAGPLAAVRRGRRRRRRIAGATASLLAAAVLAGAVGAGRVAERRAATPLAALPPLTRIDIRTDPPRKGTVEAQMLARLTPALRYCRGRTLKRAELIAYGRGLLPNEIWMIVARPPAPGDGEPCWTYGLRSSNGNINWSYPALVDPGSRLLVRASGTYETSQAPASVQLTGYLPRQAARVRLTFEDGRPPLDLPTIDAGDRYPIDFFVAQFTKRRGAEIAETGVDELRALDAAGRTVARCNLGRIPAPGVLYCPGSFGGS